MSRTNVGLPEQQDNLAKQRKQNLEQACQMPLRELVQHVQAQTYQFLQQGSLNDIFGLALFHRAIVNREDEAWLEAQRAARRARQRKHI